MRWRGICGYGSGEDLSFSGSAKMLLSDSKKCKILEVSDYVALFIFPTRSFSPLHISFFIYLSGDSAEE